jgi:glutaredoxin 3
VWWLGEKRIYHWENNMPKIVMYCTEICPYCVNAERLLKSKGVTEIEKIRIDLQPELREPMIEKTGRRTVPQIFIDEIHVGGFDDLAALDRKGELTKLLNRVV